MIEKEAGVRLGYMWRLEKPDNTSEPTMEFVSTAAKMLDVSIDFLVSANIDILLRQMNRLYHYAIRLEHVI